jgi:hypothetical protein
VDANPIAGLGPFQVRAWVCPIKAHRAGSNPGELPLPTVEWRGDVAYCLTPGCKRSSVDDFSRR